MSDPASDDGRPASADDRIVEATLGLIAEHGLGAITMRQIADTAGVARQTVYNHYTDIDAIVVAAIRRHNDESLAMIDAALAVVEHPGAKLEQLVRHFVAIGAHAQHGTGLEQGLGPSAREALAGHDAALDERIRTILDEGRTSGVFRPDLDPRTDAVLIRHLLSGLTQQAAATPDTAGLAATGCRTILAAVTAPGSDPG